MHRSTSLSRFRRQLLLSSSLLMAGSLIAARAADAQAFQGTPTVASGNVTFNRTTPGVETITQSSNVAVINWSPTDTAAGGGPINFLPATTTATYRTDGSTLTGNFTTVNRILPTDPTRQVAFNGTVNSLIYTSTGANSPGGQIWFYSPGGILVGSTGVFNVGGLVLSANDPTITGGTPYTGTNNQVNFVGASNSTSPVTVSAGATITASPTGGYVVLVAPRVTQSGTVRVNGQAAYIAGEQVNVTFKTPGQLFDISVPVGAFVPTTATDNTVLRHDGSTTGPASTGTGDPHAIYLVADPKNAAIRTLLQVNGQFGFDTATSATIANGSIVLSDGINNGTQGGFFDSGQQSDLSITGAGNVTSALTASWNQAGAVGISTAGTSSLAFAQNVSLLSSNIPGGTRAAPSISISTAGSSTLSFAGTLSAYAAVGGSTASQTGITTPGFGGTIAVNVGSGTSLSVTGATSLSTNVTGGSALSNTPGGAGGNATGGTVTITSAGTVNLASLTADVSGNSGSGLTAASAAGNGTAGTISLTSTGGSFRVTGATNLNAFANSQANTLGSSGVGTGGTVNLAIGGGSATFGAVTLNALGIGSNGVTGGAARAGTNTVTVSGGTSTFASLTEFATALGGTGTTGRGGNADATTGGSSFAMSAGTATVTGQLLIQTDANSVAGSAQGAAGGGGLGGNVLLTLSGGSLTAGSVAVTNFGYGGNATGAGTGGNGTIGSAALNQTGGSLTVNGQLSVSSLTRGGQGTTTAGSAGGNATSGQALLNLAGGTAAVTGQFIVQSVASGGQGAGGGNAVSGTAALSVANGTVNAGSLTVNAFATGGLATGSGSGGSGTGGTASIAIPSIGVATDRITAGQVNLNVVGNGSAAASGIGGSGTGGNASITAATGAISLGGTTLTAGGGGASGAAGGAAGTGTGGSALLQASGGAITTTGYVASTYAFGGVGTAGGAGGAATGGSTRIIAQSGTITVNGAVGLDSNATGGAGGQSITGAGGVGGAAQGGTTRVTRNGGGITTTTTTSISAQGTGGAGGAGFADGGAGGAATGGNATADSQAGTGGTLSLAGLSLNVNASAGFGGSSAGVGVGGVGGSSVAGNATIIAVGSLAASSVLMNADATGGGGGSGGTSTAQTGTRAGGAGGAAYGGLSSITSQGGLLRLTGTRLSLTSNAYGGSGGNGGTGGAGGAVGGAGGIGVSGLGSPANNYFRGVYLIGQSGSIDFTGLANTRGPVTATLEASGGGGNGGTGTTGGTGAGGFGGTAMLVSRGAPVTGGAAGVIAESYGGTGGAAVAGSGGNGGRGGNAGGGYVLTSSEVSTGASLTLSSLYSFADALAGAGGAGGSGTTRGGAGGAGGDGTGGITQVQALRGRLNIASFNLTSAQNNNGGNGGAGGNATAAGGVGGAGGAGGTAFANPVQINADGGAVTMANARLWIYSVGGNGGAGGAGTTAGLIGAGGNATGSQIIVEAGLSAIDAAPGSLTIGNLTDQFDLGVGTGSTPGTASLGIATLAAMSAPITLGSFTTTTISTGGATFNLPGVTVGGSAVNLTADRSSIQITGNATLRATGAVSLNANNGGFINTGGLMLIQSGSASFAQTGTSATTPFAVGSLDATLVNGDFTATAPIVSSGDIDITASGGINVGNLVSTTADVSLLATANIVTGALSAGDSITLQSSTGSITTGSLAAGLIAPDDEDDYYGGVGIDASRDASTGSISARSGVAIASRLGSVATGAIASGDDVLLLAANNISTGSIAVVPVSGTVDVGEDGANILLAGVAALPAFGSIADPSTLVGLRASSSSTGGSIVGGDLAASGLVDVYAGTTAILGAVSGPTTINLLSGSDLRVGNIGTSFIYGSLNIGAGGTITAGDLNVDSTIDLNATGAISVGAVTMRADPEVARGGYFSATSARGGFTSGNILNADVYIGAQGDVRFGNILTDTDSETNIYTNGAVVGGNVRAAEIEIAGGKTVTLGNVTTNTAPDPAANHLDGLAILGVGDVTITSVNSRNRAELYSVNGSLNIGSVTAPELIVALAGDAIALGSATTNGVAYLAGFATTTGTSASSVFINYGSFTPPNLVEQGDVNLLIPLSSNFATNSATLANLAPANAGGAIGVNALTAGSVVAASGTSVALIAPNALVARNVAAPTVSLTAGGLLSITGRVSGRTLQLASSDIAIASQATLGGPNTTALTLIATSPTVRIGGTATQGTGYTLDATEATTIDADAVSIVAPGTSSALPTVTIDSIAVQGSLASSGTASISVQTPGTVNVIGKVEMTSAAATDVLSISAGGTLRLTTPGAGIRLTSGNSLGGSLRLSASTLLVASDAAVSDLGKANTVDARAARLAQNDGPTDAAGYLQANTITLVPGRAIYVQNSGTSALGGGLTAGSGGLIIANSSQTQTEGPTGTAPEIILYGRQQTASGSFVTGGALIPATTFTGGTRSVATGSAINGCLIATGGSNCAAAVTPSPVTSPQVPMAIANVADVVTAVVQATNGSSTKSTLNPPTITTATLLDFAPLTSFADIETPVTGIGNEDLLPDDVGRPGAPRRRTDRPAPVPPAVPSPAGGKTGSALPPKSSLSDAGTSTGTAMMASRPPAS